MRWLLIILLGVCLSGKAQNKRNGGNSAIDIMSTKGVSMTVGGLIFTGFVATPEIYRHGKLLGNTPGIISPTEMGLAFGMGVTVTGIFNLMGEGFKGKKQKKRYEH
tara:strand:- start:548 stop:865 length:318 start_codon:yes stop_codon:yes gene_type:complete